MPIDLAEKIINMMMISLAVGLPNGLIAWALKNYMKEIKVITKETTEKMVSLEIEIPKTYVKTDDFKIIQSEVNRHDGQIRVINNHLNIIN